MQKHLQEQQQAEGFSLWHQELHPLVTEEMLFLFHLALAHPKCKAFVVPTQ